MAQQQALLAQAEREVQQRRWPAAQRLFTDCVNLDPSSSLACDALLGSGSAHQRVGEFKEALEQYTRCLRKNPSGGRAWLRRAELLHQLDRLVDAQETLHAFISESGCADAEMLEAATQLLTMVLDDIALTASQNHSPQPPPPPPPARGTPQPGLLPAAPTQPAPAAPQPTARATQGSSGDTDATKRGRAASPAVLVRLHTGAVVERPVSALELTAGVEQAVAGDVRHLEECSAFLGGFCFRGRGCTKAHIRPAGASAPMQPTQVKVPTSAPSRPQQPPPAAQTTPILPSPAAPHVQHLHDQRLGNGPGGPQPVAPQPQPSAVPSAPAVVHPTGTAVAPPHRAPMPRPSCAHGTAALEQIEHGDGVRSVSFCRLCTVGAASTARHHVFFGTFVNAEYKSEEKVCIKIFGAGAVDAARSEINAMRNVYPEEIRMAKLNHDSATAHGVVHVLVTRRVMGGSLEDVLRTRADLAERSSQLALCAVLAREMRRLHECPRIPGGVVHGDVKPGNILVERDLDTMWRVRFCDFEFATNADSSGATQVGISDDWVAPAQERTRERSKGADMWSLGLILYEVLRPEVNVNWGTKNFRAWFYRDHNVDFAQDYRASLRVLVKGRFDHFEQTTLPPRTNPWVTSVLWRFFNTPQQAYRSLLFLPSLLICRAVPLVFEAFMNREANAATPLGKVAGMLRLSNDTQFLSIDRLPRRQQEQFMNNTGKSTVWKRASYPQTAAGVSSRICLADALVFVRNHVSHQVFHEGEEAVFLFEGCAQLMSALDEAMHASNCHVVPSGSWSISFQEL